MRKFNHEKELSKIRNGNKKKVIISICALLVVGILGYSFALYQVRHTQKLVFNTVGEFKKRDIYLSVLVDGEYQNDFPTKSDDMLYGGYECDGSATINFDMNKWQVALYASHPDKCTVKFGHKYFDQSGANYPELYQGMIPVYFENGKIYVADITSEWYNYDENKWANAVLIDYANKKDKFYDDNGNLLGGHEVSEEDILQMYVWIPRYKYQLWNVNNEGNPKQLINITFETGTANTGNIKCSYTNNNDGTITEDCKDKNTQAQVQNNDWYMHPAFTFGNTELKGFWVGKFEPSDPQDITGRENKNQISEITILPGKTSMISRRVQVIFDAEQEISSLNNKYNLKNDEVDTHMMKNMEWGAVAYLSQSIYGIYKDEKTCNIDMDFENCRIWINNVAQGTGEETDYSYGGTYTGCVGDTFDAQVQWNKDGTQSAKCDDDKKWNTLNGMKASTTGNMYGIYDMSGGAWEYVMGGLADESGNLYNTWSGFQTLPDAKYYDIYSLSEVSNTWGRGHLGDATREILTPTNWGWNSNYVTFPYVNSSIKEMFPWFERGGRYANANRAGIFSYSRDSGIQDIFHSFRSVLSAS